MSDIYKIPLLYDHHTHVSFYMAMRKYPDVRNVKDIDIALMKIRELNDDVNIVLGWVFGYSDDVLSKIEELPATLICGGGLHKYILNQKAKDKLINKFPKIVGNIENTDWVERNIFLIMKFLAGMTNVEERDVHEFFDYMQTEYKIYKMDDMLLPDIKYIDIYEKAGYGDRLKYWMDIVSYKKLLGSVYKEKITGIKLFLDGAIGPETAALNGYINSGSDGGMLFVRDEVLAENLHFAEKENKPVAVHALGEVAIEQLLRVIEKENIKLPYIRIEHAQYISYEDAVKCKKLGIILSMQINFSAETELFKDILTPVCLRRNNPFRMLIDKAGFVPGVDLIFGSDGMPHGVETALQNALFPIIENQKITLDEFIKGYCVSSDVIGEIAFEIVDDKIIKII